MCRIVPASHSYVFFPLVLLSLAASAHCETVQLYSAGFESPSFAEGTVRGQDDWWVQGEAQDAVVAEDTSASGSRSLRLRIPPGNVYAGKRWDIEPLQLGHSEIIFQAQVWPGTGGTTTQLAFYMEPGILVLNLQGSLAMGSYQRPAGGIYIGAGSCAIDPERWGRFTIRLDYKAQTFEMKYDDQSLGIHDLPEGPEVTRFTGFAFG